MSWESVRLACRGDGRSSHCAMYGTIYRDFRVSMDSKPLQSTRGTWMLVSGV
jgi:hypothetical protein